MRTHLITMATTLVLSLAALMQAHAAAPTQAPNDPASHLAKFIGRWEGQSRMIIPGNAEPQIAHTLETAQWKLNQTAVLIEGLGTLKDPATGEDRIVHDALGIIRVDPKTNTLRFVAFKADQPMIETELEVLDTGDLRWSMQPAPNVTVRFTISLTDTTWKEIGEMSNDAGQTWREFLQMNLKRIDPPTSDATDKPVPPGAFPVIEQAVLVHLDGSSLPDEVYERYDLATLEHQLLEAIESASVGEFDGHEFRSNHVVLFMYGPNAEKLFTTIEPILRVYPLCKNAKIEIRPGGPAVSPRIVELP